MIFKNRQGAGRQLAERLKKYADNKEAIVLGLPRGGVVVAAEVAAALRLSLDIIVPRKIGAPGNPELAIGAITEEGEGVFDEAAIKSYGVSEDYLKKEIAKEKQEAERRLRTYRGDRPPLRLKNKIVILADDGVATGYTMRAAVKSARAKSAGKIIVAAPVIASDTLEILNKEADEVIYLEAPVSFAAVGQFYEHFEQTTDEEVISLVGRS